VPIRWKIEPAVHAYVAVPPDVTGGLSMRPITYTITSSNSDVISMKLLAFPAGVTVVLSADSFRFKTTINVLPNNSNEVHSMTESDDIQIALTGDGWNELLRIPSEDLQILFSNPRTDGVSESE
jgi:hypothetical protein